MEQKRWIKTPILSLIFFCLISIPNIFAGQIEKNKVKLYIPDELAELVKIGITTDDSNSEYLEVLIDKIASRTVTDIYLVVVSVNNEDQAKARFYTNFSSDEPLPSAKIYNSGIGQSISRLIIIVYRVETTDGIWQIKETDREKLIKDIVAKREIIMPKVEFIKN